jgi:3-oxoacyl-[acyl-carrier protein] reductase
MSIALVTGGGRGIGRATVEAMLADGWTVAFTYRSDESAAREIEIASAGRARGFVLDLRDRERPGDLVHEIE